VTLYFGSDNMAGVSPPILQALAAANAGEAMSYGGDDWTARLTTRLSELFEREVAVFPLATGTAANSLSLAAISPPYGGIYCHPEAHINMDECGGPEFYTGGAKLVLIEGKGAKIDAGRLAGVLANAGKGVPHHVKPAAVSLTQATEAGTVYSLNELRQLAEIARTHGLPVHMDGSRFANALVSLNCTPAAMTWRAGVDILSFGATKNGALAAEAIIVFDPAKAATLHYLRKRAGHLFSKQRYLATQLLAYLEDELWLRNARHANAMAARLAEGLGNLPGVRLNDPVQANELFVDLPEAVVAGMAAKGFEFYRWGAPTQGTHRMVTAWNTDPATVDKVLAAARESAMVSVR
jgi:threonine aldolase